MVKSARYDELSVASVIGLVSPSGAYYVAYSFLFGMSVWLTFFGGVIAFKTLPRPQFGALQHKIFRIYFALSNALSGSMLVYWTFTHPDVLTEFTKPLRVDVAQAYTLLVVFAAQMSNAWVIGPMTSKTMFQRYQQEKEEGKSYKDDGISDQMKALNKRFGTLHGISSLANLFAVIALAFHGLWLGNYGLVKY